MFTTKLRPLNLSTSLLYNIDVLRSAITASDNIEVEQELQQQWQRAHTAMLKLERKHLVRIT
jgi:hypothetical protein